MIHSDSDLLES